MTATLAALHELRRLAHDDADLTVAPFHWAHGTPDHCDTCDTLARPHGVTYVVLGHGEFCSLRCYGVWAA